MRLGYACINLSLGNEGKFKTITVTRASKMQYIELVKHVKGLCIDNLYNTYKILQWNKENNISFYRMSSDILPLVTHELLRDWKWWEDKDIIKICDRIKSLVVENNVRISMHPDQFNVINTDREEVFINTLKSLEYHTRLSKMLGNDTLILHTGGVKGNKQQALQRFISNFNRLPEEIQSIIVLENDDKSFNIEDVLYLCESLGMRCCVDFHHDRCLPSLKAIETYIERIKATWKDNTPKCHLSTGREDINDKKHADYISIDDYKRVLELTKGEFDIMLESKCKDLSVLQLIK